MIAKKIEHLTFAPEAEVHQLTRKAHGHELAEDYVEAISELIEKNGEARAVDLARQFGVSHVTVVKMVARLQKMGLVNSKPYRAIFLTSEGEILASRCQERHKLVVEFLKAIGVPEKVARNDAEGIEHHVSKETLIAFQRYLKKADKKSKFF